MVFDNKSINKNTPVPLYYQLKNIILSVIKSGELNPGDPIPTEKEISELFDISRTTIRQAILELVREGYLYRHKGKGTFVSKPKINQDFMRKLETFNEQMKRLGLTPRTKVISCTAEEPTEEVAKVFKLNPNDKVIKLVRLRYANEEPIVVLSTYLREKFCANILNKDMDNLSLYEVLSINPETKICRVIRNIEAVGAGQYESDFLNIKEGYPIQLTKTIGYNQNGRAMEYSIAHYRGDRNKFEVEIYI